MVTPWRSDVLRSWAGSELRLLNLRAGAWPSRRALTPIPYPIGYRVRWWNS